MSAIKVKERPKAPPQDTENRRIAVADGVVLKDSRNHAAWGWCDPKSKRSMTRIAGLKRLGYRPATEGDIADLRDAYTEPDGTIHKGDLILMVCEREAVESREKAQRAERESVERKHVKAIEKAPSPDEPDIESDEELHHQRVRGKQVELA